jgi:hypothetical protein
MLLEELDPVTLKEFKNEKTLRDKRRTFRGHGQVYKEEPRSSTFALYPQHSYDGDPVYRHGIPRLPDELDSRFQQSLANHKLRLRQQRANMRMQKDHERATAIENGVDPNLLANKNKMESFQRLAKPRKPWHNHTVGVYPYPKIMATQNDPQKLSMAVSGRTKTANKAQQQAAVSNNGFLDASVIAKSESARNLLKSVKTKQAMIKEAVQIQNNTSKSTGDLHAELLLVDGRSRRHTFNNNNRRGKKRRQQQRKQNRHTLTNLSATEMEQMGDPAARFRRRRNQALGIVEAEPEVVDARPTTPSPGDSESARRQRQKLRARKKQRFNFPKMPTIKDYKVLMKDMYHDNSKQSSQGAADHHTNSEDGGDEEHHEGESDALGHPMDALNNLETFTEEDATRISQDIERTMRQARRAREVGKKVTPVSSIIRSLSVDVDLESDHDDAVRALGLHDDVMTPSEKLRLQRVLKSPNSAFSGSLAFANSPVAKQRLLKNFGSGNKNAAGGMLSNQQDEEKHYLGLYEHARLKILNRVKGRWHGDEDPLHPSQTRATEDLLHLKVKVALSKMNLAREEEAHVVANQAKKLREAQARAVHVEKGMDVYIAGNAGNVIFVGPVEALGPGSWVGMRLFKKHNQGYPVVDQDGVRLDHSYVRIEAMLNICGDRNVDHVLFTNCFAVRRCGHSLWAGGTFHNGYWGRYIPALKAALVFRRFLRESQARKCLRNRYVYPSKAVLNNLEVSYAAFVPAHKVAGMHYLVGNLTSSHLTTSTLDKVRSCFEWICNSCRYDPSAMGKPSKGAASSFKAGEAVLSRKEQAFNAEDLSALFHGMCKELQLRSLRLLGLVRGNGFCKLEKKYVPNQHGLRHYWNAVMVDGTWRFFDVVQSMGSYVSAEPAPHTTEEVSMGQYLPHTFKRDYTPAYFDTPEHLFALQHFPLTVVDDHGKGENKAAVSNFRTKKISYEQFTSDHFTDVSRIFVGHQMTVLSPSAPLNRFVLRHDKHEFKMVLRVPASLRCDVTMTAPEGVRHQNWFLTYGDTKVSDHTRTVTVLVVCPIKGTYDVDIKCRAAGIASGSNQYEVRDQHGKLTRVAVPWERALKFSLVQSHDVQIEKHEYMGFLSHALDKTDLAYDSMFQLLSPFTSRIKMDVGFECKMLAPVDTHRIIAVNNGRVHELLRTVDQSRSFEDELAEPHVIYTSADEGIQLKDFPDLRILYQLNSEEKEPFRTLYRFGSGDSVAELQHGRIKIDEEGYFGLAGASFQGFALGDNNLNLKLHTDGGVSIKIEVFLGWDSSSPNYIPLLGVQPDVAVTMRNHVSLWNVVVAFPTSASVRETNYTVTGRAEGMGRIFSLYVTALS